MKWFLFLCSLGMIGVAGPGAAQSFFLIPGTEPSVGVERGSTSSISRVDAPTRFLTFGSDGAEAIGPWIGSLSYSLPGVLGPSDQVDVTAVLGGPSEDGRAELRAVGIGYRWAFADSGIDLYVNALESDFRLGTEDALLIDVGGTVKTAAVGVRKTWQKGPFHQIQAVAELAARREQTEAAGFQVVDEDLRFIRFAVQELKGIPFGPQRRLSLAAAKGLSGMGASPADNPLASSPGVRPDFLRISAAAEFSLPIAAQAKINAGVIGQWSDDRLPVSQRCGYGTNSYARGFDRSFINGDRCLGMRVELAYDVERPDLTRGSTDAQQGFIGFDQGVVFDNAAAGLPASREAWSSLSVGYRVLRGNALAEIAATRILDLPEGAFDQKESRIWLRTAIRF